MPTESKPAPLNTANSDGSSPHPTLAWDVFSAFRIALLVYVAAALSVSVYIYWPYYLMWLTK